MYDCLYIYDSSANFYYVEICKRAACSCCNLDLDMLSSKDDYFRYFN